MDEIDSITEDELVAALFSAQTAGASEAVKGAVLSRDLAKAVGRSVRWVRKQLRPLVDTGQVEPVRVRVVDIAGRMTTVPAYRLKAEDSNGNCS